MPKRKSIITGSAGEHFIAYKLSCLGLNVALLREGAPSVDIFVHSCPK